ncbi:MAG: hypothetical protein ABGX22_02005 [Pirellulaceae bacterium]|nr:hypothetical protein [Planctomycetaceae bacterium]
MRVLLTGSRSPAALELARRLHREGHQIYVADSIYWDVTACSRSVVRRIRVSSVAYRPHDWIREITAAIKQYSIDLWIPVCEEVFYAAQFHDRVPCRVFVAPSSLLKKLHNKWLFTQVTSVNGTRPPESHPLWSDSDLSAFRSQSEQWVFKPMYSRFASETLISPTIDQLNHLHPTADRGWVAQRRIEGRELCSFSIASQGRLQAHVCYESVYRVGKGAGIYFVPQRHPAIRQYVADLLEELTFTGMIGFDIIEAEDGTLWPIEANPRATSGVYSLADDGDLLSAFRGERKDPLGAYSIPSMVGFAMSTWGVGDAWKRGKLKQLPRDLLRAKEVMWRWTDPLPSVAVFAAICEFAWVARRHHLTLQQATTRDAEWNGEEVE